MKVQIKAGAPYAGHIFEIAPENVFGSQKEWVEVNLGVQTKAQDSRAYDNWRIYRRDEVEFLTKEEK